MEWRLSERSVNEKMTVQGSVAEETVNKNLEVDLLVVK